MSSNPLRFWIYRKFRGEWQLVAKTRYQLSAQTLLGLYPVGYIAYNGEIIEQKGF